MAKLDQWYGSGCRLQDRRGKLPVLGVWGQVLGMKGGSRWTAAALLSLAKALCTAIHEGGRIK